MGNDRIGRVDVLPTALPVQSDEHTSHGRAQQHVFVRLETDSGAVGWGECRVVPSWTGETIEAVTTAIQTYFAPVLLGSHPFARNAVMATIDEIVTGTMPAAKSAVDMALHDVQGHIAGLPLHELFGGKLQDPIPLSLSIRADTPENMAQAAKIPKRGGCVKMKVTGDPGLDSERVAAVAEAAPGVDIWLDANQNYTPTSALALLDRIRPIERIACLQQPVPSYDWRGMARLRERSHLPLAADEGCFGPRDVLRLADFGAADMVVLKICKAGGLHELLQMATLARHAGLDLLGSGLTEAGVGLATAVHLYSTLDLRLPPQLNGPQYLDELCVSGLQIDGGMTIRVPSGPGIGVEVDEERIRAHAVEL